MWEDRTGAMREREDRRGWVAGRKKRMGFGKRMSFGKMEGGGVREDRRGWVLERWKGVGCGKIEGAGFWRVRRGGM